MMYSFAIWDKISPINGCSAELALKEIRNSWEDIYLIKQNNVVEQIQPFSLSPYVGGTIEERAQAHVNELNYNDTKAGYIACTITDEQLAELVVAGKLTQAQSDEIRASKPQ